MIKETVTVGFAWSGQALENAAKVAGAQYELTGDHGARITGTEEQVREVLRQEYNDERCIADMMFAGVIVENM